jgi:cobyrinic acid a,c-diamide synthase
MTFQLPQPRFMIAAAHKSSGKTVISTGLAAAMASAGSSVQCFKKGPDYIDPMWLSAASGRPCYNLDFNTMHAPGITNLFCTKSTPADIALIETNKGLFDGVNPDGSDSNAALAKLLQTPVILVIDTTGITRGIAPLLLGYQAFDPDVNIAGIILNKTGGSRHEDKLQTAVQTHTDIPVFGAVGRNTTLEIGERHLGLTTPAESGQFTKMIENIGDSVGSAVDLEALISVARSAPLLGPGRAIRVDPKFQGIKIGIARDVSFGFYYPDDLEAFEKLGAKLVPFDATTATELPDVDGLFIGGGFPEMAMERLSSNTSLRTSIKTAIQAGLPTYAECGGLMYLCRSLNWNETTYPMCGVVPGDAVMQARPQGRGYTRLEDTPGHPWGGGNTPAPAHEFHYARIDNLADDARFSRRILRGHGTDGRHDGIVLHNMLAGFCHLRNTRANPWVFKFLEFVASQKPVSQ